MATGYSISIDPIVQVDYATGAQITVTERYDAVDDTNYLTNTHIVPVECLTSEVIIQAVNSTVTSAYLVIYSKVRAIARITTNDINLSSGVAYTITELQSINTEIQSILGDI